MRLFVGAVFLIPSSSSYLPGVRLVPRYGSVYSVYAGPTSGQAVKSSSVTDYGASFVTSPHPSTALFSDLQSNHHSDNTPSSTNTTPKDQEEWETVLSAFKIYKVRWVQCGAVPVQRER